jgi:hypothetical protein
MQQYVKHEFKCIYDLQVLNEDQITSIMILKVIAKEILGFHLQNQEEIKESGKA